MVFVASWAEFVEKSLAMYCAQPSACRYVWKYRPSDSEVTLKVTDDKTAIQYRSHQSAETKLVDSWNYIMLKLCTTKNPEPAAILAEIEEETKAQREEKKKGAGSARKTGK